MKKQFKRLSIWISLLVVIVFILFAANQLIAMYANLFVISQVLAMVVVGGLSALLLILVAAPIIMYLRLPKALVPPGGAEGLVHYQKALAKRLGRNPYIQEAGLDLNQPEALEKGLALLADKANKVIEDTASTVFFTTAVSQNGKLDAFTVFATQIKMVWGIAHIYWQRPALRELIHLYGNVGATALVATEIEDLDLSQQIEPVVNAVMKSPGRSIPFVGHAAHIITDSLLEGSTNAFLTLRVGVVTKRYCGSLSLHDSKEIRKSAFAEASVMLKTLVVKASGRVIKGLVQATKNTGINTLKTGVGAVGKVTDNVKSGISQWAGKIKGKPGTEGKENN